MFCVAGCGRVSRSHIDPKYSIYVLGKGNDAKEYVLQTSSLDAGKLSPETAGVAVNKDEIDRELIVRNGYYYHFNALTDEFCKYEIAGNRLKPVSRLSLPGFRLENYEWLAADSLLLVGLDASSFAQAQYVLLDVAEMIVRSQGSLNIPYPREPFKSMSLGFVYRRNGLLFTGYSYHHPVGASDYTTSDTFYVAALGWPGMDVRHIDRDTRSTYPGGINTVQSYAFTDEAGDFYFMTCPGIALGNRPDLPTAICRIKDDSMTLDKNYFLDLSASEIANHGYGLWYLGKHKAIVRSERKDLFKGLGDHWSTPHFEFYVVDLLSQQVEKLALPLDKGTRKECVIVAGNRAYIAVNSTQEGNYIWIYDADTGALTKGLQLVGDTDYMLRIDVL